MILIVIQVNSLQHQVATSKKQHTSRTTLEKLKLKNLNKVKDFEIFIDRCILDKRKGFLEIAALIQIKDIRNQTRDRVFLFNNWMFASNSSINEIEHPNYDISLKGCG